MTEKEIFNQFLINLKEKLIQIDEILLNQKELDEITVDNLKKIFHSLKGNLVSLHYNKKFINEQASEIYKLLSDTKTCYRERINQNYNEFKQKIEKELF